MKFKTLLSIILLLSIIPLVALYAQSSLTLIGSRHFISNFNVAPSSSIVQRVVIDTIVVPPNQILKLENANAAIKSNTPTGSTRIITGGTVVFELQLEGQTYGALLSAGELSQSQSNFPMWIGPGTHYIFVNVPLTGAGYRYSLHGLMFQLN